MRWGDCQPDGGCEEEPGGSEPGASREGERMGNVLKDGYCGGSV